MAEPFNDATTAPPGMSRWIRQHPVIVFVVLAYGISLGAIGIFLLAREGVLPRLMQVIGLAAKFGPSLAGVVVAAYALGPTGLDDLLRRMVVWRIGWRWGLMVLFGPLLLFGVSVGVLAFLGVAIRPETSSGGRSSGGCCSSGMVYNRAPLRRSTRGSQRDPGHHHAGERCGHRARLHLWDGGSVATRATKAHPDKHEHAYCQGSRSLSTFREMSRLTTPLSGLPSSCPAIFF